jgi:fibro-slime domain-containing protein
VEVTFYDFRSDRSNPEFEQPHGKYNGNSKEARPGMVLTDRLDSDGKPIAAHPNNGGYLNQGLRFWFRDWSNLSQYQMANAAEKDPINTDKQYLTKFRPIYTYGNNPPPAISANFPDEWSNTNVTWRRNAYSEADFNGVVGDNNAAITIPEGNRGIENAFENTVVKGRLFFQHTGNGVYQFSQVNFFPLDNTPSPTGITANGRTPGVDFPNAGTLLDPPRQWKTDHNFSFTMEMVCDFTMQNGLMFSFTGDDDVWVFINGKLAVDVGGIHEAVEKRVDLDNSRAALGGLVNGTKYKLHMFYAERHTNESNIKITTNIISARVGVKIKIDSNPMLAGEPKLAAAEVKREDGESVTDFRKGWFTWSAKDIGPNKNGTAVTGQQITVTDKSGGANVSKKDSIHVRATKAYTYVRIYGEYYDSLSMSRARDSVDVWVGPGPAAKLFIEASGDSTRSLRDSSKLDTVRILSSATADSNFYAILRDTYGNWVGRAPIPQTSTTAWATATPSVATAAPNNAAGRGKATRVANTGTTPLTVTYNSMTGRSTIKVENITYKAIEVGIKQGGTFIKLSSSTDPNNPGTLTMFTGADTTLWVRLQRSDNNLWDEVPASWAKTGLTTDPNTAPGEAVSWTVHPTVATPNNTPGTVTVSSPGNGPTANLKIVVKDNDPVSARFFIKKGTPVLDPVVAKWPPASVPGDARMYAVPSATVELTAGIRMPIVGQLFTNALPSPGTWLSGSAGGAWTWAAVPGSPSTTCANCGVRAENANLGGDSATFMSTVAHNTYQIRGTYVKGGITITQDILIRVIPDIYNTKLVIEPNNQGLTISPNASQRVNEVVFSEGEEQKVVYAVIRDQYDNYICPSGAPNPYPPPNTEGTTAWTKGTNPNIVELEEGYKLWGEWKINKGELAGAATPTTMLTAKNTAWSQLSDSVRVRFVDYDYSEIQIVKVCDNNGGAPVFTKGGTAYCTVGDTLRMDSNQDKPIYVFGKRNDCGEPGKPTGDACWEDVTGDWGRDPSLMDALGSPPNGTQSWTLSPEGTGRGQITVRRGSNLNSTINVAITVGPPLRAELLILTPAEQLIAGSNIRAVVQYYNRAGLMTEWNPAWGAPGSAKFTDALGLGPTTAIPQVISEAGSLGLYYGGNTGPSPNAALAHRTTGLNDEITFKIYYAASGHIVRYDESITVNGTQVPLTAPSLPFTVLAGPAASIEIVGPNGPIDTLRVRQSDPEQILRTVAVDEWGNPIGDWPSNWNAATPIPVNEANRPVIVYVPGLATDNGCGWLVAVGIGNASLRDSLLVCVSGVVALPLSVITRDYYGCGYLDRIEMKFRKPIYFSSGNTETIKLSPSESQISVKYNGTTMKVDTVIVIPDKDSVIICLHDAGPHGSAALQTDWLPTINIGEGFLGDAGPQTIPSPNVAVTDGAAPVIATAKLFMSDKHIEVKFSEKVKPSTGTTFGTDPNVPNLPGFSPDVLFNIWVKGQSKALAARTRALKKTTGDVNEGTSFVLQEDRLVSIAADKLFPKDEYTLSFKLGEGVSVGPPNDYINIRTSDQSRNPVDPTRVRDRAEGNVPLQNNRKVQFTYGDEPNGNMKAIPNPASPSDIHVPKGAVNATHDPDAVQGIRDGRYGGAVFEVPIYVPSITTTNENGETVLIPVNKRPKVRCQLKVYDLAGNLVISGQDNDAMGGNNGNEFSKMHLYWNGYNAQKMKVAPGTYRMVVYITYEGNLSDEDKKFAKDKKYQGLVGISK